MNDFSYPDNKAEKNPTQRIYENKADVYQAADSF